MYKYIIVKNNTHIMGRDRFQRIVWSDNQLFSSHCSWFPDLESCVSFIQENFTKEVKDFNVKKVYVNDRQLSVPDTEKIFIIELKTSHGHYILSRFVNPLSFQEDIQFQPMPTSIFKSNAVEFESYEDAEEFLNMRQGLLDMRAEIVEMCVTKVL